MLLRKYIQNVLKLQYVVDESNLQVPSSSLLHFTRGFILFSSIWTQISGLSTPHIVKQTRYLFQWLYKKEDMMCK